MDLLAQILANRQLVLGERIDVFTTFYVPMFLPHSRQERHFHALLEI